jgi:hypothetical protein
MADLSFSAWTAGRSEFYGSLASGQSQDVAEAKAIIAEFEATYGKFGTQSERDAAVKQALDAIEKRNGQKSWLY